MGVPQIVLAFPRGSLSLPSETSPTTGASGLTQPPSHASFWDPWVSVVPTESTKVYTLLHTQPRPCPGPGRAGTSQEKMISLFPDCVSHFANVPVCPLVSPCLTEPFLKSALSLFFLSFFFSSFSSFLTPFTFLLLSSSPSPFPLLPLLPTSPPPSSSPPLLFLLLLQVLYSLSSVKHGLQVGKL